MADTRLRQINALVVGAGAVGQVFGKHLANAGVKMGLYVKHKYASVADEGFEMHHFAPFGKHERRRFDDFKVYHDIQALSEKHFDQIYVCVSSPDLKSGWLEELFPHFRHAIWVIMQPGLRDYEYVASIVPERYIVQGTPGFLAYRGPLEGGDLYPPGVAWWRPPFQSTRFEGPDERTTTAVTRLLERGGLKCGVASNLVAMNLHRRALMLPLAMALEIEQWSIDTLCADAGMLGAMCKVVEELNLVVEKATGRASRSASRYSKPWYWKLATKSFRYFAPFPLEGYCKRHFTRRRRELDQLLDEFTALGKSVGVATQSLSAMRKHWEGKRPRLEREDVRDDLTPAGMVVPELDRPGVSFGGGGSSDSLPAAAGPAGPPAAQHIAPSDVSETGPMESPPPSARQFHSASQSDDVSETAPMPRQDAGSQHSLTFTNDPQGRDDRTAPVPAQPKPSFLEEDTDVGD